MNLRSSNTRNLDHYRVVHVTDANYGRSSERFLKLLLTCTRSGLKLESDWTIDTVLDFGCGKSRLVERVASNLGAEAFKYDPAIPDYQTLKIDEADLVMNTDVLEHLDENEADALLADIRGISKKVFFNIATRPAGKSLPNGENAHANVKPDTWWRDKIESHFAVVRHLPSEPRKATFITWKISRGTYLAIYAEWLARHSAIRRALSRFKSVLKRPVKK